MSRSQKITEANARRAKAARVLRIENYRKLYAHLAQQPMTAVEIAKLLDITDPVAKRFKGAMMRHGLIVTRAKRRCHKGHRSTAVYAQAGDAERFEKFIEFVAQCKSIEEEIGLAKPPVPEDDEKDSFPRKIVRKETWSGVAFRHWMDIALFGEAPARSEA